MGRRNRNTLSSPQEAGDGDEASPAAPDHHNTSAQPSTQPRLRGPNHQRGRFFRPYLLNVPSSSAHQYRAVRHPWDGRIPPYPFHSQQPPHPGYFVGGAQFFPYPPGPQGGGASRPQQFYQPQRLPYQVTTVSRPPPSESVLGFQQLPPPLPLPPRSCHRRSRGRRQQSGHSRSRTQPQEATQLSLLPQSAVEPMVNGLASPYNLKTSGTESLDLTTGNTELVDPSQPLRLEDYWTGDAGQQDNAADYSSQQLVPVPQSDMSHHLVPELYGAGQGLQSYQAPVYQPVVQRAVVGASEIVRQTEARGPGTTNFLSHTIEYFYSQPGPPSLLGPSGEPLEGPPGYAEPIQYVHPFTSSTGRVSGLQFAQPESTSDDIELNQLSEVTQSSEVNQNIRREPNSQPAATGSVTSPPRPTSRGAERHQVMSCVLMSLETAVPVHDQEGARIRVQDQEGPPRPRPGSPPRSTPTPSASASGGLRTLDHLLPGPHLSQTLLRDLDRPPRSEVQIQIQLQDPPPTQELRMDIAAADGGASRRPLRAATPRPGLRNSREIGNDEEEVGGHLDLDISMFDSINQLLPLPDLERIVQEVRDMTIDDKLAFDF